MCSVVILRRPDSAWPVLIAANRDEMRTRSWRFPAGHWPARPGVIGGQDELAGGTWMAINEHGVMAALLDRMSSLGPMPGKRSRGELPLEALDHADAAAAARALVDLNTEAYRPFHMVVVDNRDAFWLRSSGEGRIALRELSEGVSMLTSSDVNDSSDARIAAFLPRFREAPVPDPDLEGSCAAWEHLLGEGVPNDPAALWVDMDWGFGTVCSSLMALPSAGSGKRAWWRFTRERPGQGAFVTLL